MNEYCHRTESGAVQISFPLANVARVRVRNGSPHFVAKISVAIVHAAPPVDLQLTPLPDSSVVLQPSQCAHLSVRYDPLTGLLGFFCDGLLLAHTVRPIYSNDKGTFADFERLPRYRFYGLGEKAGKLEKTGEHWVLKNTETYSYSDTCDSLYASIPFFHVVSSQSCFGIYLDQIQHSFFDFGKSQPSVFTFGSESGHEIDFYVISGSDPNDILKSYFQLTGLPYLPPRRSFGLHQSRWSYKNQRQIAKLMANFRKHRVPCDLIYFDIDYMHEYEVFTVNRRAFPNMPRLLAEVKAAGYYPVFLMDPGARVEQGYPVFDQGRAEDLFLKDHHGLWRGTVWGGPTVFPDFFKERARQWWTELHTRFCAAELGTHVDIANDMNEISDGLKENPRDVFFEYHGRRLPYREFHNAYALMEAEATANYARGSGCRTLILSRAGFAGIQRYAGLWTGDNWSNYEHLRMTISMMLNLSISGIPIVGCDGFGFAGFCTPGAAIRWTQAMWLLPIMRFHSAKWFPAKEAWSFGRVVLKQIRKYIRLRYRLLPHLYNLAWRAHAAGELIVKPLFFNYPDDENTYGLDDQFLLGDTILVAPVVRPLRHWRKLYLPRGKWTRLEDGAEFAGGRWIKLWVPFSGCPVFIRQGSIVLTQDVGRNHEPAERLLFADVYPPAHGEVVSELYDDDGVSYESRPTIIQTRVSRHKVILESVNKGDSHYDWIVVKIGGKEVKRVSLQDLKTEEVYIGKGTEGLRPRLDPH